MNNNKKAYSKMLMIWIIGLIVLAVFLIWRFWAQDWFTHRRAAEMENKLPTGVPPTYIVVENISEGQIVKNTQKNISMIIPKGWEVNQFVADEDLEIRKFVEEQKLDTELQDGIVLSVYVRDNPNNLGVREWIKNAGERLAQQIKEEESRGIHVEIIDTDVSEPIYENVGDKIIAKTTGKVFTGIDFITDGEEINISFAKNNLIFSFTCTCVGSNYKNYCQECENIIKNKIQSNEF